jgi:hypothetical protein
MWQNYFTNGQSVMKTRNENSEFQKAVETKWKGLLKYTIPNVLLDYVVVISTAVTALILRSLASASNTFCHSYSTKTIMMMAPTVDLLNQV